jgi:hypothetical protein
VTPNDCPRDASRRAIALFAVLAPCCGACGSAEPEREPDGAPRHDVTIGVESIGRQ